MTTADEESEVQENVVSTLNRENLTCVVLIGWAKDQLRGISSSDRLNQGCPGRRQSDVSY